MTDVTTMEHPDVYWDEVTDTSKTERPGRMTSLDFAVTRNDSIDVDPMRMVCRCWRCRSGGFPLSDMPVLDRLLARHLLRMPHAESTAWLREWGANPNHGASGVAALQAWMLIERGHKTTEPVYFSKVFV